MIIFNASIPTNHQWQRILPKLPRMETRIFSISNGLIPASVVDVVSTVGTPLGGETPSSMKLGDWLTEHCFATRHVNRVLDSVFLLLGLELGLGTSIWLRKHTRWCSTDTQFSARCEALGAFAQGPIYPAGVSPHPESIHWRQNCSKLSPPHAWNVPCGEEYKRKLPAGNCNSNTNALLPMHLMSGQELKVAPLQFDHNTLEPPSVSV